MAIKVSGTTVVDDSRNISATNINLGTTSSVSTSSPNSIDLGGTYSNSASQNLKFKLYNDGSSIGGFGVSSGQLDYSVWLGGVHKFYVGGRERLRVRNFGDINNASYPANDSYFGVAAILKGDIYSDGYTARWTELAVETQNGGYGTAISSWSDSTWQGGANYSIEFGNSWSGANNVSRKATEFRFQSCANADGSGSAMAFFIEGTGRQFRAYGPGYTERPAHFCRAWVSFNGVGTISIRSSGNVSSLNDYGPGNYGVNFTVLMPDANYCAVGNASITDQITHFAVNSSNRLTNNVQIFPVSNSSNQVVDANTIDLAIFR